MANFTRRMLAFFLGMIFSFVLVVGGIVGGGYWAFKNLSLKDVGVEEDTLGELSSLTFEEWASFMVEIKKDPQGLTVKELEKKGLSVDSILKLLKVDPEKVDEKDLNSFRDLAIGALFSGDGMYEVNMGVIFMFLPKDAETGKYPIFSEGARNRLRQYTLGDLLAKDSQNAGFSSVLRSMKIGSVLSSVYEETIDGGDYVYTAEDMGLNLLANLEMGVLTDMSEGTQMDLGYEVKEGYLSSLAGKEIAEIIASFGAKTEDAFKEKYEGLSLVSGVLLGDLFIFDEELDAYALTIDPLFNLLSVGKLMGVTLCTKTESCPVHEDVADCDGELYEGDTVSTKPALEKVLLTNLASLNVVDMLGGLDIAVLLEGMYFGLAMGNSQCNNTEKCPVHGTEDCGENAGKWYDGDGHELGKLFGDISSYTMVDALEGHFDIEGILNDCNIGQVFNYYKVGDVWYDNTDQPIGKETVSEKIMYELYDKKISDFSSLEVSDLMKGITLGEFLNLTYDSVNDVWLNSSNEEVSVLYGSIAGLTVTELMNNSNALTDAIGDLYIGDFMEYEKTADGWLYSDGKEVTGLDKAIADIKLSDMLSGNVSIEDSLNGVTIGELLGYKKEGSNWLDKNGVPLLKESLEDKIFYQLYDKTVQDFTDGNITMTDLMDGIYLGEFLGLENKGGTWYEKDTETKASVLYQTIAGLTINELMDNSNALTDAIGELYFGDFMEYEKTADGWLDADGNEVTGLDKTLADIKISDMLNGTVDVQDSVNGVQIGELLGYTHNGSTWVDENNVPIPLETMEDRIFSQIYDKTMQDFSDGNITMSELMDGIYLGEFLGLENRAGTWYEKGTNVKASVLYGALADITMPELLNDGSLITTELKTLYMGDFMGYVYRGNAWYEADGVTLLGGVDKVIAEISLADVLDGTINIKDSIKDVSIGELLGYENRDGVWYDGETAIGKDDITGKVFYGIYGKTVSEFGSLEIEDLMEGIYLGEFLGLENREGTWYEKGTNNKASVLYGALADIEIPALLMDGNLINTKLKALYMGDFMGYVYRGNAWYEADGITLLDGVDKVIAEISLADVLDGTINISDSIKSVSIGELLGYELKGSDWYDGETLIGKTDITGKVFYGIYGKTVSEFGSLKIDDLMEGIYLGEFLGLENRAGTWYEKGTNVKASVLYSTIADIEIPDLLDNGNLITDRLKVLYVGDFMGFVNKNGTWYEANGVNALKGADKLMAEISLGDVLNGTLSLDINSLKLEDLINPNGNKVLEFLCSGGTTINGLSGKIDTMVLGDVVDTSNNTMLGLLADTKLDDLSTKINSLYVGEIMGFTKCTQNASCEVHGDCSACTEDENCHIHGVDCAEGELFWYEKSGANWVLEVGVEGRVADLTVDSIGHHGIKELNFVLGDVMTEQQLSESLFELAYTGEIKNADNSVKYKAVADVNHIPITQLAERIGVGAETASYLQLEHANLLHLEEDVEVKLDAIFGVKVVNGETIGVWEEWTVNKIFTELVNKIALLG